MKKVLFGLITLALVIGTFLGCTGASSAASSQGVSAQSVYSQESTAQSVFSQPALSQASISTPSQAVTSTAVLSQVSKSSSSQTTTSVSVSSKASTSIPVSATSVFSQPVQYSSDNETFIFSYGMFMGSFKDGVWRNSDFTVAEVLAHSYQQYRQDGKTKTAASAGAFLSNSSQCIATENADLLIPFAIGAGNGAYKFKLPTTITGAAAQVLVSSKTPMLLFDDNSYPLAINASSNPLPRPVKIINTPDDTIKNAVRSVLDNLGLPGAPVHIIEVSECDLMGNGSTQQIVIANTPTTGTGSLVSLNEYENNNSGNYSMCLVIDGTNVKIVKEIHAKYDFTKSNMPYDKSTGFYSDYDNYSQLIFPGCFDINHDGKYEILLAGNQLSGSFASVYAMDGTSAWTEVLSRKYGS